jgi:FAD/FMN-containing dehydrogenase
MTRRLRLKLLAALIAALLTGLAASFTCYLRRDFPTGFSTPTEAYDIPPIIAHKASGTSAPGNTLEAVRNHMNSDIDGLELDVQLSSDSVPMIFHGMSLDSESTGEGAVFNRTAAELSRMRLVVDGRITEHAIPTLEQVFELVGSSKFLFLDIKDYGVMDSGMAGALSALIERFDLHRTVIVESFNPIFLGRMRRVNPRVRLMFDFADEATATAEESAGQLAEIPWLLKQEWFRSALRSWIQPDLLGPRHTVSAERLRTLVTHGYPMVAWTVDDPDRAAALFAIGVVGVQTNVPFLLAESLEGRVPRALDDASRLNRTAVSEVIRVQSEQDIREGLARARVSSAQVSIAGQRHSMGGQSFGPGHLVLDMTTFRGRSMELRNGILTVQSGATWVDVQRFLDPRGRSVKVMQSDTIFTVGGTMSVNAHGWQPRSGPMASTVRSFRLMLASGDVVTCSRERNTDLFAAVLGGYGLLGVVLDAEVETVPNELYRKTSYFFPASEYRRMFHRHVAQNPGAGLSYGRLSVHGTRLFQEAGLHIYERVSPQPASLPAMDEEQFVSFKRKVFRSSERGSRAKLTRWQLEKGVGPSFERGEITRNTAMHPDIHLLWPEDPGKRDILHEYFVPYEAFQRFLDGLQRAVRTHKQELLNVTVRDVRRDDDTLLAYAMTDSFGFVLFFSQDATPKGEESMRLMTRDLIDLVLELKGTFYLPYRLHYSREQFQAAYPRANEFLAVKQRYDPDTLFSSWFYKHLTGQGKDR